MEHVVKTRFDRNIGADVCPSESIVWPAYKPCFNMIRLAFLALACASLTMHAQVGPPEWTNVPFKGKKKPYYKYWGPQCSNGNSFVLANMNLQVQDLIGYVIPEQGKASAVPVNLPLTDGMLTRLSNFHVIGGRPCLVFSEWDNATGTMTLLIQPYTTAWVADGEPVRIGTIPLDPKSYHGWAINVTVESSPDGEKNLVLFDDLQSNGIKLAMCWVLDDELNPIWHGGYRIPVQATGSRRTVRILDNGHVYIAMRAVVLNEENTKEDKDGNVKVKASTANDDRDATLYELHGETFNSWDTRVPELKGSLFSLPILVGDQVLLGGSIENDDPKDVSARWAVVELNEGLTPAVLLSERLGEGSKNNGGGALITDHSGRPYLYTIYAGQVHMIGFDRNMTVQWNKQAPWGGGTAWPRKDGLYMTMMGTDGLWKDANAGLPFLRRFNIAGSFWPMLLRWNDDGSYSYHRFLPVDVKQERTTITGRWAFDFGTLGSCGCYVDFSYDKAHPGMVRVKVD